MPLTDLRNLRKQSLNVSAALTYIPRY